MTFEELKVQVEQMTPAQAIEWLDKYLEKDPQNDDAITLRGMRYWSLGNRAAAIKDYLAAIKINPESKAKMALKATNDILDYYNKDLYNP